MTVYGYSQALSDVAHEYKRQCHVEGYDDEHDDTHTGGELALAACAYALPEPVAQFMDANDIKIWPFEGEPKFKDRRRDLVRAAALLVAEIARLDRELEGRKLPETAKIRSGIFRAKPHMPTDKLAEMIENGLHEVVMQCPDCPAIGLNLEEISKRLATAIHAEETP